MGRMVKAKYEYKCSICNYNHLKWQGKCKSCGAIGTINKTSVNPQTANAAAASTKKLLRRAKDSERNIAKRMTAIDGHDPAFRNIASSTGRIGHITGIQVDAISTNYVIENKNRKMPAWLILAWIIINQKSVDFGKNALLHVDPPNMPREFHSQGGLKKLDTMAIITQTRHEELITNEKVLQALVREINLGGYEDLEHLYFQLVNDH
jgi:hypothetical protein